eukprot:Colp12_sorted_trinity150504_noHs@8735
MRNLRCHSPSSEEIGVLEEMAGYLDPELCVESYLDAAIKHGASAHFDEAITSWEVRGPKEVVVKTHLHEYCAENLVLCLGPWSRELLPDLSIPMQPERVIMHWFKPAAADAELFHNKKFPIYIWESDKGDFYGFPMQDEAEGVKVAFFHHNARPCTPNTIERVVTPQEVDAMRKTLSSKIPALCAEHVMSKTCMYTTTPDKHFVIGKHPKYSNVNIAGGFSGHGFKFASVIGEIMSDLAIMGKTRHPIDLFNPLRFNH